MIDLCFLVLAFFSIFEILWAIFEQRGLFYLLLFLLFYVNCWVLILIDLLAWRMQAILQSLLLLQEWCLFDHDGIPKIGKSFFKWICYLSLCGRKLPGSWEIFILQLFQLSLQFKHYPIILLNPPHQLAILHSIRLQQLLHLPSQFLRQFPSYRGFKMLQLLLILRSLPFIHIDYAISLDQFSLLHWYFT